jgi:hypothetical protein
MGSLRSAYTWLIAGLLATGFVAPLLQQNRTGAVVLHVLSAALLATGIGAVAKRKRHVVTALVLAVPAVALSVLDLVSPSASWAPPRHALQTAFFAYTAIMILQDVLRHERVTAEKIRGSVCVYLLMGGTWAFGYLTVLSVDPGAIGFTGPAAAGVTSGSRLWIGDVLYFSFITLTSTGYGDMVPLSALARWMAQLEATAGQLYIAILVARLVGLHIAHSEEA